MLSQKQFIRIGREGMGNPRSQLAQSLAYFKGHVYLGVTHHRGEGPDDRSRILRYHLESDEWEEVFISPLVKADSRATARDTMRTLQKIMAPQVQSMVPLYRGIRNLTLFQGKSDQEPILYAGTISNWGAQILRSEDGVNFEVVSEPGVGNDTIMSFRSLVPFNGKMFVAPTGTATAEGFDRNLHSDPTVYMSFDPAAGKWQPAMEPAFNDPSNIAITRLAAFNEHLYASVTNPYRGFEIWKTKAEGNPPYTWQRVLELGAYRFNLNEMAPTMEVFRDALYIGSGLAGLGYDHAHDVGPAAAELIRVYADDSWDIVVGTPRATPHGLKIPVSGLGPGFDDQDNSVVWSMTVHADCLYVGTHHSKSFFANFEGDNEVGSPGGFHLWATADGDNWQPVSRDGFGNRFMYGVRSLLSTPYGLVFGTGNNYHKKKRWRWQDQAQPLQDERKSKPGSEVWLGE